jgi:protein SCO1/2
MTSRPSTPASDAASGSLLPTFAACLLVMLAGLGVILWATDQGNALTTESLRRSQVLRHPVEVPDFRVVDAQGQLHSLRDLVTQDRRVWIVDFVYPRCTSICLALGSVFQQLQDQIVARGLQHRVGLLSVSFDPEGEAPGELSSYAARMRMQPGIWDMVSLQKASDRRQLLDSFGIMVIPAPLGQFEHNAALHVLDRSARLVRIVDMTNPEGALEAALRQ